MDSSSDASSQKWSSSGRQTIKIYPPIPFGRGSGTQWRIEVLRRLQCAFRGNWSPEQEAALTEDLRQLSAAQGEVVEAKLRPAQELKIRELKKEVAKQIKDRSNAAKGLMMAIDAEDKDRLLQSERARSVVHSGDPEAIVAVILKHLLIVIGAETNGDKAAFVAESTEASSIKSGVGFMEHCLGLRDRATVAGHFIGPPPSEESEENRIFRRDFNEGSAIRLVVASLTPATQALRRRWEGTVPPVILAGLSFEEYALALTSFVQNETVEPRVEPKVARVNAAAKTQLTQPRSGAGAGSGAGADRYIRCFRCKKKGHKIAECQQSSDGDSEAEEPGLTPSDLKMLKVLLKATSTAEAKTAAPRTAHSARAVPPPTLLLVTKRAVRAARTLFRLLRSRSRDRRGSVMENPRYREPRPVRQVVCTG